MLNIAVLRPCKVQEPKPPKSKLGGGYDVPFKNAAALPLKTDGFARIHHYIFRNLKYLVFANFVQQLHEFK